MINKEKAMKDGILNKIMRIPFRQRVLRGYWISDDEARCIYLRPNEKKKIQTSNDVNTEAVFDLCRKNDILYDVIEFELYFEDEQYKKIIDSISPEVLRILRRVENFYDADAWQTLEYGIAKASIISIIKQKTNKGKRTSASSRIRELLDQYKIDDEIIK